MITARLLRHLLGGAIACLCALPVKPGYAQASFQQSAEFAQMQAEMGVETTSFACWSDPNFANAVPVFRRLGFQRRGNFWIGGGGAIVFQVAPMANGQTACKAIIFGTTDADVRPRVEAMLRALDPGMRRVRMGGENFCSVERPGYRLIVGVGLDVPQSISIFTAVQTAAGGN